MLALAGATLSLNAPAAAWDAHAISHIGTPVAIDEHHHHDSGTADEARDHDGQAPVHEEGDEGGHDHMPSLSAALSALISQAPVASAPPALSVAIPALAVKTPTELIEPPPARPPRSA